MKFTPIMAALSATLLLGAPTQALAAEKLFSNQVKNSGVVGLKADDNRSEVSTYIVELHDQPVSTYTGGIEGLKATKQTLQLNVAAKKKSKVVAKQTDVARYLAHLERTQNDAVSSIAKVINKNIKPELNYRWALNGFSARMTAAEAEKAVNAPGVRRIYKDKAHQLQTDTGPAFIGADKVWQGIATGVEAKGEGVLVGIIDSGINTDNPSFKATGDDGYTHKNPFDGYLGDCTEDATLCNDKLVGVFSYPEVTDNYFGTAPENGEDMNGHGSHTAGTAAGNVLKNVPILKASDSNVGDGEQIGDAEFEQISGVAPHANIISYQTCTPSGSCLDSLAVKAVDMAIEHGVDVINFSIGPGGDGGSPWESASAWAFLKAREAGIFVAAAAGNAGNGESTVGNVAPWTTVVANYTHDRIFEKGVTGTDDNSNTAPAIKGVGGLGEEVTAPIVYAGDLDNGFGDDLSLCNFSFYDVIPEAEGAIVVCDRGDLALMEKAQNVEMKGGVGIIIRNTESSGTNLYSIPYSIPGVLIDQESGESLMSWVGSSTNPVATLSGGNVASSELMANTANFSSSRGPSLYAPENMVPHIAAPGTDIYAAYSDSRLFDFDGGTDFSFLTGTSMASPHIAGAAALLTQLHPEWTPAEMQSAMMMSANTNTRKEDLTTKSDMFDHGAGMINVAAAAKVGLLIDETIENYRNADPVNGGKPTELNVPYMVNSNCWGDCSFTRTFKVQRDGKWTLDVPENGSKMNFEFSPASFEAVAGDEVEVTVNVTFGEEVSDAWAFTELTLTEAVDKSVLSLPIGIQPMVADIEQWHQAALTRESNEMVLDGFRFRRPAKIEMDTYQFFKADSRYGSIAWDTDNRTFFDNLDDGAQYFSFDVAAETQRIGAVIGQSNGFDMDLFIGWDSNGDGIPQEVEILCASTGENTALYEACAIDKPVPGKYWVVVHNWWSAAEGSVDDFRVDILQYTEENARDITVEKSTATEAYADYPLTVSWEGDLDKAVYYGAVDFTEKGEDGAELYLGDSNIIIDRSRDAFVVSKDTDLVAPGDEITYTIDVAKVAGSSEVVTFEFNLASELAFVSSSASPAVSGNTLTWEFTAADDASVIEVTAVVKDNETGTMDTSWSYSFSSVPDAAYEGKTSVVNPNARPVAVVEQSTTMAKKGDLVTMNAQGSEDADGDILTYRWEQISGESVSLTDTSGVSASFNAPTISRTENLVFKVTVSDGQLTSEKEVTVTVQKGKDSGSFGGLLLSVLGLIAAGRRFIKK